MGSSEERTFTDEDLLDLEPRLTWIWGPPRSGSSWLLQLLCDPLEVDRDTPLGFRPPSGEEPRSLDAIPADELSFASHLAPWDGNPVEVFGRWLPGSVINFSEGRPTYLLADHYKQSWRYWMRGLVLSRLEATVRAAQEETTDMAANPAVIIKETPTTHGADRVMELLPQSRALLLVRDPRDVVDSLLHAFRQGGFMAGQFGISFDGDRRKAGVAWAAKQWAMSIDVGQQALEQHDPTLSRIVRYEDLLDETSRELTETFSWIGLKRSADEIRGTIARHSFAALPDEASGELKRNRSASPGLWRENLSIAEQDLVASIASDRIERLGYEL